MALFRGSRYEKVESFALDEQGRQPFRGLRPRPVGSPAGVLEHTVALKDRLDGLGYHYYGLSAEWYRIAECNAEWLFPEDILHMLALPSASDAELEALEKDSGAERIGAAILIPRREGQP